MQRANTLEEEEEEEKEMTLRRLRKELDEVASFGVRDVKSVAPLGDNLLEWRVKFYGPEDSPYEGGLFSMDISFPTSYPFKAPTVRFRTCIYHPSVCRSSGKICSEMLSDTWSPNKDVKYVIKSVQEVLSNPTSTSPIDHEVARQYSRSPKEFARTAREWTRLYAK